VSASRRSRRVLRDAAVGVGAAVALSLLLRRRAEAEQLEQRITARRRSSPASTPVRHHPQRTPVCEGPRTTLPGEHPGRQRRTRAWAHDTWALTVDARKRARRAAGRRGRADSVRSPRDRMLAHRLLTAAEERALGRLARQGDRAARNALVAANVRLAADTARKARTSTALSFDDLLQEAVIGVIRAAELFDPDRGTRFSTYAVHWIRQAVQRAQANHSRTIRLPVHVHGRLVRLHAALAARDGDPEDPRELAEAARAADLSVAEAEELIDCEPEFAPATEDELETVVDPCAPTVEEEVLDRVYAAQIWPLVDKELGDRERQVLAARAGLDGEGTALREVGARCGISGERVRQIEADIHRRLRNLTAATVS